MCRILLLQLSRSLQVKEAGLGYLRVGGCWDCEERCLAKQFGPSSEEIVEVGIRKTAEFYSLRRLIHYYYSNISGQ